MLEIIGWIANFVLILGHYQLGNKNSWGFFLILVGELGWLYPSVKRRSWSLVFLSVVFSVMAIRNWWLWQY